MYADTFGLFSGWPGLPHEVISLRRQYGWNLLRMQVIFAISVPLVASDKRRSVRWRRQNLRASAKPNSTASWAIFAFASSPLRAPKW
jgi:hypothetical protein